MTWTKSNYFMRMKVKSQELIDGERKGRQPFIRGNYGSFADECSEYPQGFG
jgi:hypothetical protein